MAHRERELIDQAGVADADLRANLHDQMRLNRILGVNRRLVRLTWAVTPPGSTAPVRILDAGCGGGDLVRALVQVARRRSQPVAVTALDRSEQVLRAARDWSAGHPEIRFLRGDVTCLPFPARGGEPYDFAICANTLHHLEPGDVAPAIAGLAAVTRGRLILSDLRRSAWQTRLFPILARALALHPMSRHDGQLSLRHALTAGDLAAAATAAGLHRWRLRRGWLGLELVWDRG